MIAIDDLKSLRKWAFLHKNIWILTEFLLNVILNGSVDIMW